MSEEAAVVEALVESAPAPVESVTPAPEANVEPSIDDQLGAVWDKIQVNGSERGENGKFVSTKQPEQAVEQPQEGAEKPEGEKVEEAQPAAVQAPAHLPQSIKAKWEAIPADARDEIAKYVQERDLKVSQLGRSYEGVKRFGDTLAAAQKELPQLRDMPPERLAREALELAVIQKQIAADPVSTILQIAQRYNAVDGIRAMLAGQQPSEDQNTVSRLTGEINDLKQRLAEAGDPQRIDQHITAAFQQREVSTLVNELSQGKEHYAIVEPVMPDFINMAWQMKGSDADRREVFDLAYDMAVNAMPSVRDKVRATVQAAPPVDPKRTETAKRAASINVTSAANGKERILSEDELLAAAFDRKMAS